MRISRVISRDFRGTPFRTFVMVVALAVIVSLVFSTVVLATGVLAAIEPAVRTSQQEPYEATKRSLR
jgi:hypothetical protein